MLSARPKKLAFTLVVYAAIALTLSSVSEAQLAAVQRRELPFLHRLIRRRSPQLGGVGVIGAGPAPPGQTPADTAATVTATTATTATEPIIANPPPQTTSLATAST